jgi:hypothetical protein
MAYNFAVASVGIEWSGICGRSGEREVGAPASSFSFFFLFRGSKILKMEFQVISL